MRDNICLSVIADELEETVDIIRPLCECVQTELITQNNQFSYGRDNISDSTVYALLYAYMIKDTTNGCIAFRSDCSPNEWNGWAKQFTDESGHTFYK